MKMNKGYKLEMETNLFNSTINDLKTGTPIWEDFIVKATKLHTQLKSTINASTAFLDAFQKIADMATSTRGGTKDVGSALTRLCLRHRSVESRLKTFTSSIMDCLILPLQDRLEEWKKTTQLLDKEHAKEYKRLSSTMKLHKKMKGSSNVGINAALSKSMESVDCHEKWSVLEEMEKRAVRRVLIEERSRFCIFVTYLRSVVDEELAMFHEFNHLKEVMDSLTELTSDPFVLPSSSELVISDMKITSDDTSTLWPQMNLQQTPPSSPSSFGSRKSSLCSISSYNSSSSESPSHHHGHPHHSHPSHCRYRSLSQPAVGAPLRMLSISSQDSGFISQPDYGVPSAITQHHLPPPPPSLIVNSINTTSKNGSNLVEQSLSVPIVNQVSSLSGQSSESTSSSPSVPLKDGQEIYNQLGRPHTISSGQERLTRPPLTQHTFEPPNTTSNNNNNNNGNVNNNNNFEPTSSTSRFSEEPSLGQERNYPNLPSKPSNIDLPSDYSTSFSSRVTGAMSLSSHELLSQSKHQTEQLNNLGSSSSKRLNCHDEIDSCEQQSHSTSHQMKSSSSAVSEECQHIYANFGDLSASNDDSNLACSEGSITPTNADRSSSPTPNDNSPSKLISSTKREPSKSPALKSTKNSSNPASESLYSSTGTLSRPIKPAPPPPVRKTSSISDPNAITLGTLKSAGVSTYEEIKTLKRNVRNHSGSSCNTYEELNSDRNAVYHAARKSCISTSLTSLVEPIYSTLDSNSISISNPFNSKIVTINTSTVSRPKRGDSCKSNNASGSSLQHHHSSRSSMQGQHMMKGRCDDDMLPPPPPEAYSDSENHHGYHTPNRIVNMRKEFLQTLNAKLSVPQNQRVSPKLVKRRSMSLPHSDQEWDSDSGIISQSSSSKSSSQAAAPDNHSESFAYSLVKRLSGHSGGRNSHTVGESSRSSSCSSSATSNIYSNTTTNSNANSKSRNNNSNNDEAHSTYSSFSFTRYKHTPVEHKNSSHYDFGRGSSSVSSDGDNASLSKMMLNSSQQSQVAKAAASEAIRRKKSLSDCSSIDSNSYDNINNYNSSCSMDPSTPKATLTNNVRDSSCSSHYHERSSSGGNIYATRNQSFYMSTSQANPLSGGEGGSSKANHQKRSSQPSMGGALSAACQILLHQQTNQNSTPNESSSVINTVGPSSSQPISSNNRNSSNNCSMPSNCERNRYTPLARHEPLSNESDNSSQPKPSLNDSNYSMQINQNNQANSSNCNSKQPISANVKSQIQIVATNRNQNTSLTGAIECFESAITARVHNWLAGRTSVDLISCRENLMDQIRKGKQLRKVLNSDEERSSR